MLYFRYFMVSSADEWNTHHHVLHQLTEGKGIFIIGDLIRSYENVLGYFKHFRLFVCSVLNSDILGRTVLGVILDYASRLGKY